MTKLEGLHLIDFDKTKIVCDQSTVTEYNRLRSLYTPHLGKLEAVHATKRKADSSAEQSSAKCRKKEPMKNCKSGKTRQQPHKILQPENIAHTLLQQPDCAQQIDIIHTDTEQNNIYQYCEVTLFGPFSMCRSICIGQYIHTPPCIHTSLRWERNAQGVKN